jgi:O-antigen ligase
MAFLVLSEWDPRQAMQCVIRRTSYILIPFSLLLIKYFPEYGRQYAHWSGGEMWAGVTTQKNGLGRLCLISAFFLIWTLIRRWKGRDIPVGKYQTLANVFVLSVTLYLLKGPPGAYSASAIGALAGGLATLVGLIWMQKHRIHLGANTLTIIMALVIVYGVAAPLLGGLGSGGLSSALGRDTTLTGRTEVWAQLVPLAMRQPILGGGFGSMWTPRTRAFYKISEGHNGYLDVLLELGFVGMAFVSMFLLSSCRKAHRELTHDFDWGSLWICYLLMAGFHNVTETSFSSLTSYLTAVLLFVAVTYKSAAMKEDQLS